MNKVKGLEALRQDGGGPLEYPWGDIARCNPIFSAKNPRNRFGSQVLLNPVVQEGRGFFGGGI